MKLGMETAVFVRQLEGQLRDIEIALGEAGKSATVVDLDQARTGRLSRVDALQQQAMGNGLIERFKVQRRRILAALDRARVGEYGACCGCHDPIAPERLAADPAVPFCGDCQEEMDERRQKA